MLINLTITLIILLNLHILISNLSNFTITNIFIESPLDTFINNNNSPAQHIRNIDSVINILRNDIDFEKKALSNYKKNPEGEMPAS